MQLSVRSKIVFTTVGILVIAVAAVAFTSSYMFSKEYSKSLLSQALVIGQNLKQQLDRLLHLGIPIDELVGFEKQCREVVNKYPELAFAMVINRNGKILFHNDPSQQLKTLKDHETTEALKRGSEYVETLLIPDDDNYDVFIPVFDKYSEYVAMVRVAFPTKLISQKTHKLVLYSGLIAAGCLLLAIEILVFVLDLSVNRPLAGLVNAIATIKSRGTDTYEKVQIGSTDEIGQLGMVFNDMIDDLNQTHATLRTYTQDLESRVEERTAQLRETNDQLQRDILERRRVEASLRESEERLHAITHSAMDAVVLVDERGVISYWNPAATHMFGFEPEEAVEQEALRLLVPEEYHNIFKAELGRAGSADHGLKIGKTLEATALRKGGTRFPVEFSVSTMNIKGRWHAAGIIRDISDRKRLEGELARVQKFESIGVLAGGLAHDFNNLLAVILGNISVAQTYLNAGQGAHQLLADAETASFQARDLILQLIALSQSTAPTKRLLDIAALVRDAVSFTLAGSNIRWYLVLPEALWPVDCDANQIRQVITQLVLNAREAMPEGGEITVEVRNEELQAGAIAALKPGRYVRISVLDQGVGIPANLLPRIFDPYVSGKQRGSQKGMGLGLTIAYAMVKKHEGHIEAQSLPGKGSTFHVYLPASEPPPDGAPETARP
jgi:PAS domain S-box-containing protein